MRAAFAAGGRTIKKAMYTLYVHFRVVVQNSTMKLGEVNYLLHKSSMLLRLDLNKACACEVNLTRVLIDAQRIERRTCIGCKRTDTTTRFQSMSCKYAMTGEEGKTAPFIYLFILQMDDIY